MTHRLRLRLWCRAAQALGMPRLVWTQDDDGWRCRAPGIAEATGETGLEALKRLVTFRRATR